MNINPDFFWILGDVVTCFPCQIETQTCDDAVFLEFVVDGKNLAHLSFRDGEITFASYDYSTRKDWLTLEGIAKQHNVELQEWVRDEEVILK